MKTVEYWLVWAKIKLKIWVHCWNLSNWLFGLNIFCMWSGWSSRNVSLERWNLFLTLSKTITNSLTKTVIPLTLTLGKHQGDSSQQVCLPVKDEIIKLIAHRRANRTAFLGLSVCLTLGNGRRTSQSRKRREQCKNQPFICIEGPLSTQDQIRCPHTITENIHRA